MKFAPTDTEAIEKGIEALTAYGIERGDELRFRRHEEGRWSYGTAITVDVDGSIGLRDTRGRRRSIDPGCIQTARRGLRGGKTWSNLDGPNGPLLG